MTTPQLFQAPAQPNDSDERYTPAWVFQGLELRFDLDPCAPVAGGDCVPARTRYTIEDDGLARRWHGLVWCNPPFSNADAWARRFVAHGQGIFLGPVANAKWRRELIEASPIIWLCDDFAFTHPDHAGRRSSMALLFAAIGDPSVSALASLATSGRHPGTLMTKVPAR